MEKCEKIDLKCNVCSDKLNNFNWSSGKQKKGWFICNNCHTDKYKKYRKKHPFKARLSYFNKRYDGNLKVQDLELIYENQKKNCPLCGDPIDIKDKFCLDHVVARNSEGLTTKENIQILCENCNIGKFKMSTEDYIKHCEKVVNNYKKND
jgi:5-methylcytosine-specific restriction endonuclease McrA